MNTLCGTFCGRPVCPVARGYNMNALKQGDRYAGLKENIRKIYHYHKGRYGYRRITLALRKQGLRINHKTVQRLMAELSPGL